MKEVIEMKIIDLRSDTVTKPTEEMRMAMANAEVGDDVYGEDPTVNRLEALAARMVGKEAALFVPSGTFGNQLAIFTHTQRGDEIIVERNAHIKKYEVAGAAALSGVQIEAIPSDFGKMPIAEIEDAIRDATDIHEPPTRLICLENATGYGTVLDLSYMQEVRNLANQHQLKIHLDGARLFNAATALNVNPKQLCELTDTVMFCLSKGLCAPVGSILAGSKEFINKARKNRKLMGGGMRQVGILAASGIIALEKMTTRLNEDHDNAKYLASQLETIPGVIIDRNRLDINMVFMRLDDSVYLPENYEDQLLKYGIQIGSFDRGEIRLVTHHGISKRDIDKFISIFRELLIYRG